MTDAPAKTVITIDDLLRLGAEDQWVEIVDGEVIPMSPTGFQHNFVTKRTFRVLDDFVEARDLGYIGGDGLIFVLHVDEEGVRHTRIPDVFFIRKERLPDFDFTKPFPGAPDLAIEVVSPSEDEETILDKLESYFTYGSEQVWVLYPAHKAVYQYFDLKTVKIYRDDDVLTAESLFPGLEIQVSDFFTAPQRS